MAVKISKIIDERGAAKNIEKENNLKWLPKTGHLQDY